MCFSKRFDFKRKSDFPNFASGVMGWFMTRVCTSSISWGFAMSSWLETSNYTSKHCGHRGIISGMDIQVWPIGIIGPWLMALGGSHSSLAGSFSSATGWSLAGEIQAIFLKI